MFNKSDLIKISDCLWEIPKSFRKDMLVPARIYISEKMLEEVENDAINQVINVATLPGIVKYSLAMPDIHSGYGFAIGGVAATKYPEGVISPGGVGYDIACSVRLLRLNYSEKEIKLYLDKLTTEIQKEVPSGLGRGRQIKLSIEEINKILEGGVSYLVEKGYGEKEDIENCEERGKMEEADASVVSGLAKNRGRDQLGTLGSGNHFCELQKVEKIFDEKIAEVLGLFKDQIVIMVHCGSRGLGHQIATDYIRIMMQAIPKYGIKLPDRELVCAPFNSPEGQKYFKAMCAGANYSWSNKHMITHYIRKVCKNILGKKVKLQLVCDVAHNIAKIEEHKIDGKIIKLIVHRKGATRSFPNQPVLIPGTMGTSSYVLVGTEKSKEAFYSVCHGAGRTMSRHAAKRKISGREVLQQLTKKGIIVKSSSLSDLAEEVPLAYKDVDEVIKVVCQAGLAKKIVQLKPLAVIKG